MGLYVKGLLVYADQSVLVGVVIHSPKPIFLTVTEGIFEKSYSIKLNLVPVALAANDHVNIVKTTKIVNYNGKPVKMVVVTAQ